MKFARAISIAQPSTHSNAERSTPNFWPASSFLHKQSPFQPLKRKNLISACLFFTLFCGTDKENLFNSQDLFELVDRFSFSSRSVCLIEQFYCKENWMSGDVPLGVLKGTVLWGFPQDFLHTRSTRVHFLMRTMVLQQTKSFYANENQFFVI